MKWMGRSLFKVLCKCLFSEVTVQAVTELDNKAAHCHSPVLQRHRPFLGRRLDCQPHHFFHRVVCREHFTLFDRMADHAVYRLDGIRRIDHFAYVRWISEERGKIRPVSLPASAYLRIATVPSRSERFQCLLTCLFRGSLINRFQVASDGFVVLP